MSQSPIYDNSNWSNNTNSFNVWNKCTIADDRSPLLAWLSPLEPKLRHRDIQESRADNVGEWLLQTETFRSWHDWSGGDEGPNAVLFCYGDPGVGKTFISSLVVDRLCDQAKGQNSAVTCFYFDFADRKEQSVTSTLGSLLRQVVGGLEKIPEEISRAFQEGKNAIGGRGPRLPDIVKMLQAITASLPTFVCIDALDECSELDRVKLLNSLQQILKKSPRTRIFIIGRPHIRDEIERLLSGRVTCVSVSPRRGDITEYLHIRLGEDPTPHAMNRSLEEDILERIPETMSEMFLLVSLSINAILHESTIHRRRERLNRMTDGLRVGDVYNATIERIKAQDGDQSILGMAALMWVSHAERPLRADELCHALAVELDSTDFNSDNIPSISTLLSCCQGLITVDKEASTARLIHFTLKEYLSAHPDIFTRPHSAMAEICLTYLGSRQVKSLSTTPSPGFQNTPFLEYSSVFWGAHAERELSDHGTSLALNLLSEHYGQIPTKLLLRRAKYPYPGYSDVFHPFSGLHCASFFGIGEVVAALIEIGYYDINGEDFSGRTPLAWAAHNGHQGAVKTLLGWKEVKPDKPDNKGRTPLSFAARCGHGEVVKTLLGRKEVKPDRPDNDGRTPLLFAAWYGHEEVVKTLLEREEVNPGELDIHGRTPLSFAAWYGHEGVVKALLGRKEVDPDKPDRRGRTPLSIAAGYGREGVVNILLERKEVTPDKPDNDGRTPLSVASEYGRDVVVKTLLERREVNPGRPDNDGQTPLLFAAWYGHEGVVKALLGREVSPSELDIHGRTPLSFAARGGHEGVVKILLGRKEVDPDRPDNDGQTPLSFAAGYGHEGVVKTLLGREGVNPDKPDNYSRTPLSFAAGYGHEGVVKILLGREVNPDRPDNDGRTPFSFAAQYGHERVVELLQSRTVVTPRPT